MRSPRRPRISSPSDNSLPPLRWLPLPLEQLAGLDVQHIAEGGELGERHVAFRAPKDAVGRWLADAAPGIPGQRIGCDPALLHGLPGEQFHARNLGGRYTLEKSTLVY